MKVIHRVKTLIDNKNISISAFEKSIEMSNNSIQTAIKREASVKDDVINKILNVYSDVSPLWLLMGKGEMLLKDQEQGFGNVDESPTTYQQQPTGDLEKDLVTKFANISNRDIAFYTHLKLDTMMQEPIFKALIENLATKRALELLKEK